MKPNLSISFLAILVVCGFASAAGLVANWTFDEGSGTVASDSAGGYNGTIVGATWAEGVIGGALDFNGVSDYVEVPHNANLNITGDITIAAWVCFRQGGTGTGGSQCIVTKCLGSGATYNPYDFRTNVYVDPTLTMVRASKYKFQGQNSNLAISLNEWHHVAVTVSGSYSTFYVDGIATSRTGYAFPTPAGNTRPLYIGRRDDGMYFNGLIDEVSIYDYALDTNEIAELYNEATAASSISDHFDDGVLDPAWNITYNNASGWTYTESGTNLTVTGITSPVSYAWNDVFLTRDFSAPGDFEINTKISWDSGRVSSAMQTLYIRAYSGTKIVVESGYCDAWIAHRGGKVAKIESNYIYNCQMNTLPVAGTAEITMKRENGFATIFWDNAAILTGYSSSPIDKVELIFSKYVYPRSTFGSLSVDYINAVAGQTAVLDNIEIVGPNSVAEESDTQYKVTGYYSDGTSGDVTADANFTINSNQFAFIDANGLLMTERLYRPSETCTIKADCKGLAAKKQVSIYPVCDGNECTKKQLAKRNLADAIEIKQDIVAQLNHARKIETATYQMLGKIGMKPKDSIKTRIEILAAITYESWACRKIDDSIGFLENANQLIK
ncbi:MAG: LamG domain-containing protein [Planctomycetaceae bacterium]|nr:LamG domain-containing protein [Planctomycetaceae bacterium]